MNILVADDEKEIADLIEIYLKNEDYQVYKYYDSKDILKDLEKLDIDLAILDVMMPELDGFLLCSKIREQYNFPIIFVTAKMEDIDKISGLALGADDYITKPFVPLELVARVKAQLRRYTKYGSVKTEKLKKDASFERNSSVSGEEEEEIDFREIVINRRTHEFYLKEQKIELTPIEFSILWLLCKDRGSVIKTDELFREIWKEEYYEKDNNTVMVHIRHLREKMEDSGKKQKYIKTVWGIGYKIER